MTARERSMLQAVAAGHTELICGCEPDLVIDGRCCCDQYTAHRLTHAGFIRPAVAGAVGQRVPAELTATGQVALRGAVAA